MSQEKEVVYLESILKPILSNKDELKIERTEDKDGVLLKVSSAKEDTGVIIGSHGETAKSIRRLIHIIGSINKKKISVHIENVEVENEKS